VSFEAIKPVAILFSALIFMSAHSSAFHSDNWVRVVESEGNFSIKVPGDWRKSERKVADPVFGDILLHQYVLLDTFSSSEPMVYTLLYTDYPSDLVHQDSIDLMEEFFLATAESAEYSVAGKLIYSDELHNMKCPGYTWRIHYNQGEAVIRSRAYLCCSRLYIISVAGPSGQTPNERIFPFFDSFRLITPCIS